MRSIKFPLPIFIALLFITSQAASSPDDKTSENRIAQLQGDYSYMPDTSAADTSPKPSIKQIKNFPYGSDRKQSMDIYLPPRATAAPVILMVHGGGWRFGGKWLGSVYENKAARWVPKGFIFIAVNYRLLPGTDPLKQAEDVARALAVAQKNAASWGGDPTKFILMGHSAGAHLVDLLTVAPAKAYAFGAKPWLGTVSLDSGAIDVVEIMERKHDGLYDTAFGSDKAYWKSASPMHNLTPEAKPILAVCSSKRPDAPCTPTHRFAEKAATLDLRVMVLEQALTHGQINQELGLQSAYTDAVEVFMSSLDSAVKKLLSTK